VGRILAVDPGDVRIGLAVSDPTRTIARPLKILQHRSRQLDAQAIVDEAIEQSADMILVGLALDRDGEPGHQARKALRLVDALRQATTLPIQTSDETGTTERALELGSGDGPIDSHAAAVLLQGYLDAQA
jgi:putative Holliday junction resolvase